MINFFTPPDTDQSMAYLGIIFGQVGNMFPTSAGTVMGQLFLTFNGIILTVGVLVVIYTIIVGLLSTAHEGKFLGEKFHGLWTPIRTLIGIAALVPTAQGYCAIQILMMWVLVQGIGAADSIWNVVVNYKETKGSLTAPMQQPSAGVQNTFVQIFQGLACANTAMVSGSSANSMTQYYPNSFGGYYCTNNTCPSAAYGTPKCNGSSCTVSFGPNNYCGTLTYCNPASVCSGSQSSSVACTNCQAQTQVLTGSSDGMSISSGSIIGTLSGAAAAFAGADMEYQMFYYSTVNNPGMGSSYSQMFSWIGKYCSANGYSPCCNASIAASQVSTASTQSQNNSSSQGCTTFISPNANNSIPTDLNPTVASQIVAQYYSGNVFSNLISTVTGQYMSAIYPTSNSSTSSTASTSPAQTALSQISNQAQQDGWVLAGAYYYYLAQANNANQISGNVTLTFGGSTPGADPSNGMSNSRNNFQAAGALVNGTSGSSAPTPAIAPLTGALFSTVEGNILDNFMSNISGSSAETIAKGQVPPDPLVSLQSFGESILIAMEVLYVVVISIMITLGVVSSIASVEVLGTGLAQGLYPVMSVINVTLMPLILGVMGIFISFGGMLAVYTPLIPYIIFVTGAIGWFGSTIEAMIAAPLVALGILSPGGGHEILGKAEHSLLILFAIFLRPTLMIFGMAASMLLSIISITIINSTFNTVMSSITSTQLGAGNAGGAGGSGAVDILELIFFIAAYTFLVLAALNKCFAMIYIIPQRVMTWIGGQGADYGEAEALQGVKGGVEGAGSAAASSAAGTSGMSQAGEKVGGIKKAKKDAQAQKDRDEVAKLGAKDSKK